MSPRQVLHLIDRAENMLAEGGAFLTERHRARLVAALAEVKAIAPGMDVRQPVEHGDVTKIITLARLVGGLGPARESIKKRAAIEATRPARGALVGKVEKDALNVIIREEEKPGLKRRILLKRVNKRWKASGGSEITYEALRGRQRRQKKRAPWSS